MPATRVVTTGGPVKVGPEKCFVAKRGDFKRGQRNLRVAQVKTGVEKEGFWDVRTKNLAHGRIWPTQQFRRAMHASKLFSTPRSGCYDQQEAKRLSAFAPALPHSSVAQWQSIRLLTEGL